MLRNSFLGGRKERKNLSYAIAKNTGGRAISLKQMLYGG